MRTKTLTPLLVAATMTFVLAGAALALPHATAKMTGAQEVPPVAVGHGGFPRRVMRGIIGDAAVPIKRDVELEVV